VQGDEGVRLENTCAVCLLKHVQYRQDLAGEDMALNYIRTRDGKEIDFVLTREGKATHLIEVKLSDDSPSPALRLFAKKTPEAEACQLVQNLRREQQQDGVSILMAGKWLADLSA
jgi:predicted AAA+ superfamily ATPase